MREIKFRAWDRKFAAMLNLSDNWFTFHSWDYSYSDESYTVMENAGGHYTIMQYTGLKDNNGVEIYEGDILRNSEAVDAPWAQKVVFDENEASFMRKDISDGDDSLWEFTGWDELKENWEIIGNIYENPELLNDPPKPH